MSKEKKKIKIVQEFKEFISRGSVVDMAVGIIIGTAFNRDCQFVGERRHYADCRPDYRRHQL